MDSDRVYLIKSLGFLVGKKGASYRGKHNGWWFINVETKRVQWLFPQSTGWWVTLRGEACLSPFWGGQHFHQSPEWGTEKLIRFVEHLGFIHVRCQKRGVAVDRQGCWWRWSSQEGRKWEVRVTLAVKSLHVNCWFAVNIGFLNKERTGLWSFRFKRWKLKRNMHKNDGICRMNKDLFSKFYDPN